MNLMDLVAYEISGSWWASWMPFGHEWTARYMMWKTKRKMKRYEKFKRILHYVEYINEP